MTLPASTTRPAGAGAHEYLRRLERVRHTMAERSMAALVVTDPANMFYLTGYNTWSFYTPQCLVVPESGDPVLFAREMDATGAGSTAYLSDDLIEGYPEHLIHRPDVHPFDWIAERVRERGLVDLASSPLVGVEGDSHFFSARGYLALQSGLPGARLEDSRELVNWARVIKSDLELAQMRIAGSIAQRAMEVALAAVAPGRRQCDAVAEILAAQAQGTDAHGGDYTAILPMLPTGEGAGTPHLTWTDEPFRSGEATTIEIAGAYRRYHSPIARTIMLGDPSRRLASTASVVRDGMARVLEELRPGRTPHEIHAVWDEVISAQGLSKASRIGYSIGVGYPPDWGERTISLRSGEDMELEAGMCFHVMLGMWMDGWGYALSEPVAITSDGVERLTNLTQDLTIGG
ncbi:MAG: M24 family metallopeptidase [Mycobacteriaceae bacterium]